MMSNDLSDVTVYQSATLYVIGLPGQSSSKLALGLAQERHFVYFRNRRLTLQGCKQHEWKSSGTDTWQTPALLLCEKWLSEEGACVHLIPQGNSSTLHVLLGSMDPSQSKPLSTGTRVSLRVHPPLPRAPGSPL